VSGEALGARNPAEVKVSSLNDLFIPSASISSMIELFWWLIMHHPPAVGVIKSYCDLSVCPSPMHAAAIGYRHTGCLQLSHMWTADPSADGRRSAMS